MNEQEYEHGQAVDCPHNIVKGDMNNPKDSDYTEEPCNGATYWDIVLEGVICTKCQLYTGVK
jgi:hypothetical protein